MNTEVGAGTLNSATFLRVLGPEPWKVAYVEPSVRPDDARYGENPNRIQTHTQFQVILKPEPGNAQELYLDSLTALGIDVDAHDVRFVEDNWASPALGAWGLGWEVWLDGLEITQFTYFQQSGGVNLDPVSVEITYGLERILMALQGVRHFKDIVYAEGVSYGELYGPAEYQMSRYYLDDADVAANRDLLEKYANEATRMIEAKLPIPAHNFLLKCSHAFNVLDARGAVSTSERAAEFGRMRRIAGDVARLWVEQRAELDHPLGEVAPLVAEPVGSVPAPTGTEPRPVVFEIGTEELAPAEGRSAATQLERLITEALAATRLEHGAITVHATPRRLVALIDEVAAGEPDATRTVKGPKLSAAYDADGNPTKAAAGFARSQNTTVEALQQADFGGNTHLALTVAQPGRTATEVLCTALGAAAAGLRSAKNMRWRDPGLAFTRPIRWLLALYGDQVIPVQLSTLTADRMTRLHRTDANPVVPIPDATAYLPTLFEAGIVVDLEQRRTQIQAEAHRLSAEVSGVVDITGEAALIDQIAFLVEQPTALLGSFDESYLRLPEAVLATVMRKHQRYLPIRDAAGKLLPHFVIIANGHIDPNVVRAGNEAVLRARYEDAAFFHRADAATSPADLRARLSGLTFSDKLGSMRQRADRISELAGVIADTLSLSGPSRAVLDRARELIMFDHGSQMVTELTSLAGVMAREYATAAGEPAEVAQALYELELPRQAGDDTPRSLPGAILALASRADLLTGLAATVGLPTGSSDPFAIRRAALGLFAIHRTQPGLRDTSLHEVLAAAAARQPVAVSEDVLPAIAEFLTRRLEQLLVEEGQPVDSVRAALVHAQYPSQVDETLAYLNTHLGTEAFTRLQEAITRVGRIVPAGTTGDFDATALSEPAELAVYEALNKVSAQLDGQTRLDRFAETAAELVAPIEQFFDAVLVMADDPAVRAARLGLLASIRDLSAPVLDWPRLP